MFSPPIADADFALELYAIFSPNISSAADFSAFAAIFSALFDACRCHCLIFAALLSRRLPLSFCRRSIAAAARYFRFSASPIAASFSPPDFDAHFRFRRCRDSMPLAPAAYAPCTAMSAADARRFSFRCQMAAARDFRARTRGALFISRIRISRDFPTRCQRTPRRYFDAARRMHAHAMSALRVEPLSLIDDFLQFTPLRFSDFAFAIAAFCQRQIFRCWRRLPFFRRAAAAATLLPPLHCHFRRFSRRRLPFRRRFFAFDISITILPLIRWPLMPRDIAYRRHFATI